MPFAQVGDIELYYESHGSGDPLVLIGGLGLAVSEMRALADAFTASGYRVIAADNRGAGLSAKPPGPYTIRQMAGDVAGLLTQLGVERTHVLGISMGGRMAMSLALDYPNLVDHLVLVSTGARTQRRRWRVRLGLVVARLPLLRGKNPPPTRALRAQFLAISGFDCTARLGEVTQPTLIVHGRADHVAPLNLAQAMSDAIPGARLVLLNGGHDISLTPPRVPEFAATVLGFLPPSELPDAARARHLDDSRGSRPSPPYLETPLASV
jgi:pimeloyl-ACP methyl ester carboxylesterase